jgi:superfamily II DNA or RNA helicase
MPVELTDKLLANAAGWDVMKRARFLLEQERVLSSFWSAPLLRGVVQEGENSFRGSLVIKSETDIENLCTCRDAREWGKICTHGVAVGLHWLRAQKTPAISAPPQKATGQSGSAPQATSRKTFASACDPKGEPASLCIIFPPNFEQAVARGKVMLVIEAQWSGGRSPLNALPKARSFAFSEADLAIVEQLEIFTHGETPAILQIGAGEFAELLPALAGHSNITLGKSGAVTVSKEPWPFPLKATLEKNGEIVLSATGAVKQWLTVGGWVWRERILRPLGLPAGLRDLLREPMRLTRAQVPQFLSQQWPQLAAASGVEANFKLTDFNLEPQPPRFLLELKGGLAQLGASLQCAYGARIMTLGVTSATENVWLPDPQSPTTYATRDPAAESAALARLQRSGFSRPDGQGRLQLHGQDAVLNFFAREFPKLQREWTVTLEERLERSTAKNIEHIQPQFRISSGVQWFDLGVVFATEGGETFSAADIQRLLLSGQSHARLKNGKIALIDTGAVGELQEVLLDCSPKQQDQVWRINNTQAGFLEATLREHAAWKVQAPPAWRERAAGQSGQTKPVCPPLGHLENVLRPYQKEGVAWLRFLRENNFGGILADEMGLGKTIQTLAFLHSLPNEAERRPHLIVCPTSLVFNWIAEAKKFTPTLKALALDGPDRHAKFEQIAASDIVVTSYALLRRDAARYRELEFDALVLDEAQHIKNRQTQNAQAVKAVRARQRFVLTGTPMENSVLDLWSIFDFLMPGYLGSAQDFRERYEVPITREKSEAAQRRLARRLRPFLLRRLKKEVAPDLPARLEQVSFCELTPAQRDVYTQLLAASRKEMLEAVGDASAAKSRMLVLTALLRLRQACCDLRLLKLEGVDPAAASSKLDLFDELLEEVIDGGHRVLVFSQFVSMLALVRERLTAEGIEHCYLDGSTNDRAAVVERFQKNATIPVFLISLKAGGVGLNLTGADTVIHFDPWWNPAVEDQATGRAHRIGQTKVVTSYKLIARDTVEEKILTLQNRKREIIQATIGGEEEFAASLSWDEIQELLS